MNASEQQMSRVRSFVLIGGVVGLILTLSLAYARDDHASGMTDVAFAAIFISPFVLALLSLRLPGVEHQRWIWLVCAVIVAVTSLPLIFNGVGFFLLAIAICFGWPFVVTRRKPSTPETRVARGNRSSRPR